MQSGQKICLCCKYFRLESVDAGLCRVDKDTDKNYPAKNNNDHCLNWHDCGQQYFIRLGWIKSKTDASNV